MLLWTFALPLIIAFCFFCGMQTELKKREKEADNKILIHLVIWYAVIILLMNMNDSGWDHWESLFLRHILEFLWS